MCRSCSGHQVPDTPCAVDVDEVLHTLRELRGLDLRQYRRTMLERRILRRMAHLRVDDPEAYLHRLRTDATECGHLIDTIMINVSSFFRSPVVFELIAQRLIPAILDQHRRNSSREIRIWSAGCAAGEEAYSVAILLHQALKDEIHEWRIHVFATDVDTDALSLAATAVYPRAALENTKLGVLDTYFLPQGDGFQVQPWMRSLVHFSHDDLTSPLRTAPAASIFGAFDMVLCRNVLIYLDHAAHQPIVTRLHRSLGSGGFLVLGEAESLPADAERLYIAVDRRNRIFRRQT